MSFEQSLISSFIDDQLSAKTKAHVSPFRVSRIFKNAYKKAKKYTVFKGGRGSGKTFFALSKAVDESYREDFKRGVILVMRELMGSLDDLHGQVVELITQAGLIQDFDINQKRIKNKLTGCEFRFRGARSHSGKTQMSALNKMKGMSRVKMVIVEEAQDMTADVLNFLIPTINRDGKIALKGKVKEKAIDVRWVFCMNPNKKRDPTIEAVEALGNCIIEHVNIFDVEEDFQDKQLLEQAKSAEGQYYYGHVWLGEPFYRFSGYPFANVEQKRSMRKFKTKAFLDPSFVGGDLTSLCFVSEWKGKIVVWGYCWREAWNTVKYDIKEKLIEHNCEEFFYESNAIATAPQETFAGIGIDAIPRYSLGDKHNRIYQVAYEVGDILILIPNKGNSEFNNNFLDYNKEAANDDAADSFASNMIANGLVANRKIG